VSVGPRAATANCAAGAGAFRRSCRARSVVIRRVRRRTCRGWRSRQTMPPATLCRAANRKPSNRNRSITVHRPKSARAVATRTSKVGLAAIATAISEAEGDPTVTVGASGGRFRRGGRPDNRRQGGTCRSSKYASPHGQQYGSPPRATANRSRLPLPAEKLRADPARGRIPRKVQRAQSVGPSHAGHLHQ